MITVQEIQKAREEVKSIKEAYEKASDERYQIWSETFNWVRVELEFSNKYHEVTDKRLSKNPLYVEKQAEADGLRKELNEKTKALDEMVNLPVTRRDIDLNMTDQKGRKIGIHCALWEEFTIENEELATLFHVYMTVERDGYGFGAMQRTNTFATAQDREAYIEKRRKQTLATYTKKFKGVQK